MDIRDDDPEERTKLVVDDSIIGHTNVLISGEFRIDEQDKSMTGSTRPARHRRRVVERQWILRDGDFRLYS